MNTSSLYLPSDIVYSATAISVQAIETGAPSTPTGAAPIWWFAGTCGAASWFLYGTICYGKRSKWSMVQWFIVLCQSTLWWKISFSFIIPSHHSDHVILDFIGNPTDMKHDSQERFPKYTGFPIGNITHHLHPSHTIRNIVSEWHQPEDQQLSDARNILSL